MVRHRFRAAVAVYGILRNGGDVLLMRRAGSGYHDGELSLPAGHLDGGEDVQSALVRELLEELTITVDPGDCQLCLTAHRAPETAGDAEYIDLFFTVDRWRGTPSIGEPDKCTELLWAMPRQLPRDVIGYVDKALQTYANGERLMLGGWDNAHLLSP
ncbi:MAG: NUDIX domain-containing protein [Propionibacteriaceae bacterium]